MVFIRYVNKYLQKIVVILQKITILMCMKRIEVQLPDDVHLLFKKYCDFERRSMQKQILWMIEDVLEIRRNINHKKAVNNLSIAEKNQAGRLGKAGVQPGSKD